MISRVIVIVLDACGIGEAPDAAAFGDSGANTLVHTAAAAGGLNCPNLARMGLGYLDAIRGVPRVASPEGCHGRMIEVSPGKDSTTGHWELMGLILDHPFPLYPAGFPLRIIDRFRSLTGRGVVGNCPASGTEIIARLGDQHCATGDLIVYTSADSVFQIAAHEEIVPVEQLYRYCEIARGFLVGEDAVARVIARPFVGLPGAYVRTHRRRDFSLRPPGPTLLDRLMTRGIETVGIGKIDDLFAGQGLSVKLHTTDNDDGMHRTTEALDQFPKGMIFTNLVEFDMLWGHRNDVQGFARALERFDVQLGLLMDCLTPSDALFISADHGCDPTTPSTDHSRELVPILAFGPAFRMGVDLGTRASFADLAATIGQIFGVAEMPNGRSFLADILSHTC